MKRDTEFHDYVVHDLMGDISGITSRAMFGGWGIYKNGVIFAIITGKRLYFKVGDVNRADFEAKGSKPFHYTNKGKDVVLPYWELPEEIMEDRDALPLWTLKAVSAQSEKRTN